jgi:hypothetical protein
MFEEPIRGLLFLAAWLTMDWHESTFAAFGASAYSIRLIHGYGSPLARDSLARQ